MRKRRKLLIAGAILATALVASMVVPFPGCGTHTVISGGLNQESPDGRYRIGVSSHGATRRQYIEQTKKTVLISIYRTSASGEEARLHSETHHWTASDLGWRISWPSDDLVTLEFFDYGDGVSGYDVERAEDRRRQIASLRYARDPLTDTFHPVPPE